MEATKELCKRFGFIYTEPAELAWRRRRCGKGFSYVDAAGKAVSERADRERIKRLAIPPAWEDVFVAKRADAHLQAIGRDAKGRLQYRYHPDWTEVRAEAKEGRLLRFGKALPRIRQAVKQALLEPALTRRKMVAAVVRLIDRALLRPGYEEYARSDGGRGASTLLTSDVELNGDAIALRFEAKGGKKTQRVIKDRSLAQLVKNLMGTGGRGRRLFASPGHRPVNAREVNEFLAETSGQPVSAKDFRTFHASAKALARLASQDGPKSEQAREKTLISVSEEVSEDLANTRAVARSSYIHPAVIEAYRKGALQTSLFRGRLRSGLSRVEIALLRFFETREKQQRR